MDNAITSIFLLYTQVNQLCDEQLALIDVNDIEQTLETLCTMEHAKRAKVEKINNLISSLNENDVSDTDRESIKHHIINIKAKNEVIKSSIEAWYSSASTSMKQVSTHRKTLQSYGGTGYADIIPYYFDVKK